MLEKDKIQSEVQVQGQALLTSGQNAYKVYWLKPKQKLNGIIQTDKKPWYLCDDKSWGAIFGIINFNRVDGWDVPIRIYIDFSQIQDADAKLLSQNDFINNSSNNRKVFMPASYVCSQVGLKCLQNFQEFIICTSKAFNKLGY